MWVCRDRFLENEAGAANSFQVTSDGIYAVIFNPIFNKKYKNPEKHCGIFCKNKRQVYIIFFLAFPTLLIIGILIYKLLIYKLRVERKRVKCVDRE